MKQTEIEAKIKQAFTHATPDVLASVLAECQKQKGRVIMMPEKKSINVWIRRFASAAAVLVLVVGLVVGFNVYKVNHTVASTISLDVNPSIEIKVNHKEKILDVNPLNDDGRTVVGDMDFDGHSLEITVNALIGSMLREGYLSELSNSILISVENSDPVKGTELQTRLTNEVKALLQTNTFNGAVLSQTISLDDDLLELAESYGITIGKAQLIQQIRQQHTRYTFEMLVPLTINELNLLRESAHLQLNLVTTIGTASDMAYIGVEEAKQIALTHASVMAADISEYSAEMEYEDGVMVYEIEFYVDMTEYNYDINALTGAVVKSEIDMDDDDMDDMNDDGNMDDDDDMDDLDDDGNMDDDDDIDDMDDDDMDDMDDDDMDDMNDDGNTDDMDDDDMDDMDDDGNTDDMNDDDMDDMDDDGNTDDMDDDGMDDDGNTDDMDDDDMDDGDDDESDDN